MNDRYDQAPGALHAPPPETAGFVLNHTMLRVRDPQVALDFYTRVFGMRLLRRVDFADMRFSLYFLAHVQDGDPPPSDRGQRMAWTFGRPAVLELTHNWGTEQEAGFSYHHGNAEPKGFGHICFAVPDLAAAMAWLERNGVPFVKRPQEGKIRDVAFIKDPDGYWIEVLEPQRMLHLGEPAA
ncbi:Lactoylglutathione lyase [Delftia tsuruhatensis]|uniref:lactoylglutathione lyase n=1 Tax=Delftia tsuruhatensis TaxID=180282 RepID=UPI001E7DECD6|nr:lactoylglutathione lyase [Delftia tsuruhatensis]CAB5691940.1 Lactoylglutathione lyase [Delftia tsuruhatensis]CAC9676820.1 Lactoylglutathione lyase [Delftia tsuruhatensis]